MDSSFKPLEYGKVYQVEKKATGFVLTIEPDYTRPSHQQWVSINIGSGSSPRYWTWPWTMAIFSTDVWYWHDIAEILNEKQ